MNVLADLHLHTTFSDGRLTVAELCQAIAAANLAFFSITDHDSVAAYAEVDQIPALLLPRLIAGIEFSTDVLGEEVHILGYGINPDSMRLHQALNKLNQFRRERLLTMTIRLRQAGFSVDDDELLDRFPANQAIGRPHLAAYLVEKRYFHTVGETFRFLLAKEGPVYLPHVYLSLREVIALIDACGGVAMIAHPGAIGNRQILLDTLDLGIAGLEVYHPSHDLEMTASFLALARERGLLVSGGSDFHAIPGRLPQQLGVFGCPSLCAEALQVALRAKNHDKTGNA